MMYSDSDSDTDTNTESKAVVVNSQEYLYEYTQYVWEELSNYLRSSAFEGYLFDQCNFADLLQFTSSQCPEYFEHMPCQCLPVNRYWIQHYYQPLRDIYRLFEANHEFEHFLSFAFRTSSGVLTPWI